MCHRSSHAHVMHSLGIQKKNCCEVKIKSFQCCASGLRHNCSLRLGNTRGGCGNSTFARIASQQGSTAVAILLRAQSKQDYVWIGDDEWQLPNWNLCKKEARIWCCCFLGTVDAISVCCEMECAVGKMARMHTVGNLQPERQRRRSNVKAPLQALRP